MIISALDIIQAAYGLIGVWDTTSALTAYESQLGLTVLNDMIGSWNLEQLSIYTDLVYELPFLSGCSSYQVGLPQGQFIFNASGTALTIVSGAATPAIGQTLIAQGILPNTTLISGSGLSWVLSQPVVAPLTAASGGLCSSSINPYGALGFNWAIPRPTKIERISIRYNTTGSPYEIPLGFSDLEHWQAIPVKTTQSTYPLVCYNDASFPYMNLNFWPVPTGPANCIVYAWDPLSELNNLTNNIELPPGYNTALKYNLAIELAIYFDREPSPALLKKAETTKHTLASINQKTPELHYDPMFTGANSNTLQIALASRGQIVL